MAKDYLSAPASSVSVEREFSRASDIATEKRANLLLSSIKITHELKSYFHFGGKRFTDFLFEKLSTNKDY